MECTDAFATKGWQVRKDTRVKIIEAGPFDPVAGILFKEELAQDGEAISIYDDRRSKLYL
ncbi:MAG TPA: hypothetical protein DDZ51_00560 [Planctomycetaceae bacterium]|nr:hypothetical protein [Planctomycetaceae bacterium]